MPYLVLYVENADAVATFKTLPEAKAALENFVANNPQVRDEVAVLEVDHAGQGVGQYVYADLHAELFA